jgi:hypothetical protein
MFTIFLLPLFFLDDDQFQQFVKIAPSKWEQFSPDPMQYSTRCELAQTRNGQDLGTATFIFKRLNNLSLVEWRNSNQAREGAAGINSEYSFQLDLNRTGTWTPSIVGDDERIRSAVLNRYNGFVANPDRASLILAPGLFLPTIPWSNAQMVTFLGAKELNSNDPNIRHVEMSFRFAFDDSVRLITGTTAEPVKSAKIVFEANDWLPLSSEVRYEVDADNKFEVSRIITRDSKRQLASTEERLRSLSSNDVAVTVVKYENLGLIPQAKEFRLPYYGLPEFKRDLNWTDWLVRIIALGILVAITIFIGKKLSRKC